MTWRDRAINVSAGQENSWRDRAIKVGDSKKAPYLDIGLRTMTGSFNPGPAMPLPDYAPRIPYTTGQQAGAYVTDKLAEEFGKRGHPKLGAAVGTAAYMIPEIAKTMMIPDIPVPKFIGKAAGAVGRTGARMLEKIFPSINEKSIASVFTKPLSLFTAPTKKAVSEAYANSEIPQVVETMEDNIKKATGSIGKMVKEGAEEVRNFAGKGVANARKIFEARQALDNQIAKLQVIIDSAKQGKSALKSELMAKYNLRNSFNEILGYIAPGVRTADAMAAARASVEPFRRIFLPGKSNFFTPEGLARIIPGVPPIIGTGIATAGGIAGAGKQLIKRSPKVANIISALKEKRKKHNEDLNP